jgi:KH domain
MLTLLFTTALQGGSTISAIQTLTDTKIKLSQSNEYFPGTHDRVGLIVGDSDAVRNAVAEIMRRLSEVSVPEALQLRSIQRSASLCGSVRISRTTVL